MAGQSPAAPLKQPFLAGELENSATRLHLTGLKDSYVPSFISSVLRFVLKLVFGLLAAVFALSLLLAGVIYVAFSLLVSLFTGRPSTPAMVFSQFRRFQRFSPQSQGMWSNGPAREASPASPGKGDVVDVEVREVRSEKRLP
jgi:hypothetical protein